MRCRIKSCPGEYADRLINQVFNQEGALVVVKNIPAEICDFCGDTLLSAATSQRLDDILACKDTPREFVPVYSFAEVPCEEMSRPGI